MAVGEKQVVQHITQARFAVAHLNENVVCVHTTSGHVFQVPAATSPSFAPGEPVLITVATVKED